MSLYQLPEGLPVPVDVGACDHVPGLAVLYVYPRTGRRGRPVPDGFGRRS